MSVHKIVFINQKGGVGKTTTAVNVGASLAKSGNRVLLVDLDSQGNLTTAVSADLKKNGIYELMTGKATLDCIQPTPVDNLFCISGGIDMAGLEIELVEQKEREFFLKKALTPAENDFDFILMDCPPALNLVTMNALAYTDSVIIPMQCEFFAMEGLSLLLKTVNSIKKKINPSLEILGIVFTMYSRRANLNNEVVADITGYFRKVVFETKIPRNVRISEAPSHGLPINVYDRSCVGAKAYDELTKEVLDRVNR